MSRTTYPTLAEVEAADHLRLAFWQRFLPSPGMSAVGTDRFAAALVAEGEIQRRIVDRLKAAGGITPGISKTIGWGA